MNGFQDHLRHVEGVELTFEGRRAPLPTGTPVCVLTGSDGQTPPQPMSLPLDASLFSHHLLVLGNVGTGKTEAISKIMSQVQAQLTDDDIMIVFDTKGDFHQRFYRPGDVVVSNDAEAFGYEGDFWNLFSEITLDRTERSVRESALEIANTLFADKIQHTSQPFFPQAAKDVLATFLTTCALEISVDDLHNEALITFFEERGRPELQQWFASHNLKRVGSYLSADASAQADGVVAELHQLLGEIFVGDFRRKGGMSIRDLIRRKSGRTIFIEYDVTLGSVLAPIYRLLIDLALKEAMAKKTRGNVWVFIDEFRLIPNLQHIDNGINFGRSQGLKILIALQNIPQVHHAYGEAMAESLLSGLSTLISFRVDDSKSREFIQNRYGYALKKLVQRKMGQVTQGQISEEIRPSKVVEDWDISRLAVGTTIIGLPGKNPFVFRFDP
jgi:hypothetical protein